MAPEGRDTHFYVHALTIGPYWRFRLCVPERVDLAANPAVQPAVA
jgi:hypothetical protein